MDLTPFTDAASDLGTAVGVVGAALVTAYVGTKTFGFVIAWIGKLFSASKGRTAG